eukprot:1142431-Pelagomonas_calceolata.AAC.10
MQNGWPSGRCGWQSGPVILHMRTRSSFGVCLSRKKRAARWVIKRHEGRQVDTEVKAQLLKRRQVVEEEKETIASKAENLAKPIFPDTEVALICIAWGN